MPPPPTLRALTTASGSRVCGSSACFVPEFYNRRAAAQAQLRPHGYDYFVIDGGWSTSSAVAQLGLPRTGRGGVRAGWVKLR